MNVEEIREKLHLFVENGTPEKVMAIYTLLSSEIERDFVYDKETIDMLMKRREDVMAGTVERYSLEESKERITQFRNKNGV